MESFYDRHGFDAYDSDGAHDEPRELKCKRCGSTDVRWRRQTDKWVLFNTGPGEHVCEIDTSNEFEDLT